MNISFAKTQDSITGLNKFVTRRFWKPKTIQGFKAGSIHSAWTQTPFVAGARRLGKIRALKDAYVERLGDITPNELIAEGNLWNNKKEFFLEFFPKLELMPEGCQVAVARFVPVSLFNAELNAEIPVQQTAVYAEQILALIELLNLRIYFNESETRVFDFLQKCLRLRKKDNDPASQILRMNERFGDQSEADYFQTFFYLFHIKFFGVADWLLYAAENAGSMPELLPKLK